MNANRVLYRVLCGYIIIIILYYYAMNVCRLNVYIRTSVDNNIFIIYVTI